jgi:response regulator NasT
MTAARPDRTPHARIVVAADDADTRHLIGEQLTHSGHVVLAQLGTAREAIEACARLAPDLVLLDVRLPDGSGVDAAREIVAAAPATAVVFVTGDPDASLDDDEVLSTAAAALLATPTQRVLLDATVRLATSRARELTAARDAAALAARQLADRTLIERAKGVLMRRTGSSEQEAYRILQRTSQDRAVPMTKIAQGVLDSEVAPDGAADGNGDGEVAAAGRAAN